MMRIVYYLQEPLDLKGWTYEYRCTAQIFERYLTFEHLIRTSRSSGLEC